MQLLINKQVIYPFAEVARQLQITSERVGQLCKFYQIETYAINRRAKGLTEKNLAKLKELPRQTGRPLNKNK